MEKFGLREGKHRARIILGEMTPEKIKGWRAGLMVKEKKEMITFIMKGGGGDQ